MIGEVFSGSLWLLLIAQATVCIALGLAASFLLRRSAARAHQALLTAVAMAILTPGAYTLVRHFQLGILASEPAPVSFQTMEPVVSFDTPLASMPPTEVEYEPAPRDDAEPPVAIVPLPAEVAVAPLPWDTICLGCWITLTAILLGRLAMRFLLGLRLLGTARPVPSERLRQALELASDRLGIAGPIQIRCSERIKSPIIWCWTRQPVLLVHARADTHPDGVDWASIFCHELAHLKRRDHISGLFAELLTALLPWHPLLWWAKARLAKLSEQACDDWVLAAGQSGVDYAETLLGLTAQKQMAFVPTVIGKEKTMSMRIRRIIKDRCGDPRVGARWMAGVSLLAILAIVSVGFAQRQPAEREIAIAAEQPAAEQPQPVGREEVIESAAVQSTPAERREPTPDWQREVLQRKLDELAGQIQNKETMLRENRDLPPEERRVQEFELEILYEMAAQIERRLRNIERPAPTTTRGTTRETAQQRVTEDDLAIRRDQLERRLQTLRATSDLMEKNLRQDGATNPDVRRDLEAELDKTHQEMRKTEDEFRIVEKRQQAQSPVAEQPRVVETRRRRGDVSTYENVYGVESRGGTMYGTRGRTRAEQNGNRTETRVYALEHPSPEKMRTIVEVLSGLPETTVTPLGDNKLAVNTTTELHLQIEKIIHDFDDTPKPPLEAQVQDLRSQMQGLQEQIQQMQKLLEQVAQRGQTSEALIETQEP
ncbi:MAG: M56 family metallopeptidase [Phycisphaerales bacterium]